MEVAYRTKDELLTMKEKEVQQIPLLRAELEQLNVRNGYSLKSFNRERSECSNLGVCVGAKQPSNRRRREDGMECGKLKVDKEAKWRSSS